MGFQSHTLLSAQQVDEQATSITFNFPDLAAETNDGTNNLSPGPKMLLGRIQQVRSPFEPFELITRDSPSAFVAEYVSLC